MLSHKNGLIDYFIQLSNQITNILKTNHFKHNNNNKFIIMMISKSRSNNIRQNNKNNIKIIIRIKIRII